MDSQQMRGNSDVIVTIAFANTKAMMTFIISFSVKFIKRIKAAIPRTAAIQTYFKIEGMERLLCG